MREIIKSRDHAGDVIVTIKCNSREKEEAARELFQEIRETAARKNRRERYHGGEGFGYTVRFQKD